MEHVETFKGRTESYVVVKDSRGEEYLCPQSVLKRKSEATAEELKHCVPESQTGGGSAIGGGKMENDPRKPSLLRGWFLFL